MEGIIDVLRSLCDTLRKLVTALEDSLDQMILFENSEIVEESSRDCSSNDV